MPARRPAARGLKASEDRYRRLCAALARLGPIKKGSLYPTYTGCGSPGCKCHRDPKARHGPYWYWTGRVAGKVQCRQVSGPALTLYRRYTANYRTLKKTVSRLERLADEILARQLAAADASSPRKAPRTRTR